MTESTAQQPAGPNVTKVLNKLNWYRKQQKRFIREINRLHDTIRDREAEVSCLNLNIRRAAETIAKLKNERECK